MIIKFLFRELQIFLTALMFFTRIPVPSWVGYSQDILSQSSRYFSGVGLLVGSLVALVYYLSALVFPHLVAILLSTTFSLLLTGAFHEDGFADFCDGFGGGWTKTDILRIMKDSRLGTYGVLGVTMMLALKVSILYLLPQSLVILTLILGHSVSRLAASSLLVYLPYVRDESDSKVKPIAEKMSGWSFAYAGILSLSVFFLYPSPLIWLSLLPLSGLTFFLALYMKKWLGGHTGDCAGATQQLNELLFYLFILGTCKYF